jgi:nucleoside recognition membrane protein YjiH
VQLEKKPIFLIMQFIGENSQSITVFKFLFWPTVPTSSFRNVNQNMALHMLWHHWCTWPHAPKRISPLWLAVQ